MVQNLMVQAEEFSQVQHLRWGLTEKEINKKTHDKRKKDGARQIYKVVFLRQGVGGEPRVRLEKQVGANYTRSCITCFSLYFVSTTINFTILAHWECHIQLQVVISILFASNS